MRKTIAILFLIFFNGFIFSQQKIEKEYRIKPEKVPKVAVDFVTSNNFKKRVKWFTEESNDGKTFEAKVCHEKHLYSIEFSEEGILLDIEKKVDFKNVNKTAQQNITSYLTDNYSKFRFKKVQIQYKGISNELQQVFISKDRKLIKAKIAYELIINAKKDGNFKSYEMLFDENGIHLKSLPIAPAYSLNLEF